MQLAISCKRLKISALASTLILGLYTPTWAMPPGESLSPAREMEISLIDSKTLDMLAGLPYADYSVMAVSNGSLLPIPFQFDEISVDGFVYLKGGKLTILGEEDIFDEKDVLGLMYQDTGPQASEDMLAAVTGEVIAELTFDDHGRKSYAYVLKGNSERSKVQYANFNRETGVIKTDHYVLNVDPDNVLVWSDFMYRGFKKKGSLLDTMKIRVKAGMGPLRANIKNHMIPNRVVAVRNAPVRSFVEMDASISALGVDILSARAPITITAQTTQFPVFAHIPAAAAVLPRLDIEISLDFHELEGAKYRTALGPKEPTIIGGGGADPDQLKISKDDHWLSLSSGEGYDIIAFLNIAELDLSVKPLYIDAGRKGQNDKPERYKGGHPQVGYILGNIPTGADAVLGVDLFYSDRFWADGGVEKAAEELANPVPVQASALVPVLENAENAL